jgi:hypothetical protein
MFVITVLYVLLTIKVLLKPSGFLSFLCFILVLCARADHSYTCHGLYDLQDESQ